MQERAQVGHYYLLKRDYTEALRWYTEAERGWPAVQAETVRSFLEMLRAPPGTPKSNRAPRPPSVSVLN